MKKFIKRYKKWKVWCRYSRANCFEKILTLLIYRHNLWFEYFTIEQ